MTTVSIPLFPLSDVVLFPGCLAPLHIFEPRYRQMTDAALEAEVAVQLLRAERQERIEHRPERGDDPDGGSLP